MTGQLFIGDDLIGQIDFNIISESMGVIGGNMIPSAGYSKYQPTIRKHYKRNGISNIHDFNFRIILDGVELKPEGGIGVTDSGEFNEILVESGGLDQITLGKLRK